MFGDDDTKNPSSDSNVVQPTNDQPAGNTPADAAGASTDSGGSDAPAPAEDSTPDTGAGSADDSSSGDSSDSASPAAPAEDSSQPSPTPDNKTSADSGGSDAPAPAEDTDNPADSSSGSPPDLTSAADTSSTSNSSSDSGDSTGDDLSSTPGVGDDELLSIKKDALSDLSPLVDKLDQSSEEKFRTTMMMIQASDDQTLIKRAYDNAKEISDEKERAQALLDIVNEINYFTHSGSDSSK